LFCITGSILKQSPYDQANRSFYSFLRAFGRLFSTRATGDVENRATIRTGENDHHYTLGNAYMATLWGARNFRRNLSGSLRLAYNGIGDIDGADPAPSVNPDVVPTARTDLRAGNRIDAGLGLNIYMPRYSAFRIALEGLMPVYQNLDGPQLETDWTILVGIQLVPVH
jgi:hypothetical protein